MEYGISEEEAEKLHAVAARLLFCAMRLRRRGDHVYLDYYMSKENFIEVMEHWQFDEVVQTSTVDIKLILGAQRTCSSCLCPEFVEVVLRVRVPYPTSSKASRHACSRSQILGLCTQIGNDCRRDPIGGMSFQQAVGWEGLQLHFQLRLSPDYHIE
jgi:hypothetical protein